MATNLEHKMREWHDRNYRSINVPATVRKLLEEVGELVEAAMRGHGDAVFEEAGDVGLLLNHLLRAACGFPRGSLQGAMQSALEKCLDREKPGAPR